MRYGYGGYGDMMWVSSPFASVVCIVIAIDLVLVGVWLWQQIKK